MKNSSAESSLPICPVRSFASNGVGQGEVEELADLAKIAKN